MIDRKHKLSVVRQAKILGLPQKNAPIISPPPSMNQMIGFFSI